MKQGRAMPFIVKDSQSENYVVTKEALNFLSSINTPVSVVTVAGLYRTGKSYLLNRVILNQGNGFTVGPTINACTKGLWIWSQVILTADNKHMIVIDTEGLGSLEEESNHDMKIFCLAVLLSTTFIYNSVGSIDENALQSLSLVLNLVNYLDQDSRPKPSFIWVIRDFTLQLIDENGRTLTSKEYLEKALSGDHGSKDKNIVRTTISKAFAQRDCFTLIKPLIDQQKLQNLDNVPIDQLRGQFVTQTMALRKKILSTLKEVRISSQHQMNGRDYVGMVQKYLQAINQGEVPNIKDTWSYIKSEKTQEVVEALIKSYSEKIKAKFSSKVPMKNQQLLEMMEIFKAEITQDFNKQAYEEGPNEELDNFLRNMHLQLQKINIQQSRKYMENVINKQFQPFCKKLYSGYYNHYGEFVDDLEKSFVASVISNQREHCDHIQEMTDHFLDKKIRQSFKFFDQKSKDQICKLTEIKTMLQNSLNQQLSSVHGQAQETRKRMQQEIYQLQRQVTTITSQKNLLEQQKAKQKSDFQLELCKMRKRNQDLTANVELLGIDLSSRNNKSQQCQKLIFLHKKELEKERALSDQKEQFLNNKCKELEKKLCQLQGDLERNTNRYDLERKEALQEFENKLSNLINENKVRIERIYELESQLQNSVESNGKLKTQLKELRQTYSLERQSLRQPTENVNKREQNEIEELRKENRQLRQEMEKGFLQNQSMEAKCKQTAEQLKSVKNNSQKQIVIHLQQIQFLQIELSEMKASYAELQRRYQNALDNMQGNSKQNQEKLQLKIYELTEDNSRNMKYMEQELEQKIKEGRRELQFVNKQKEDAELQLALERKKAESRQRQHKEAYSNLETLYESLSLKLASSEHDNHQHNKERENFFVDRIKKLEAEIEDVKEKSNAEILENKSKSQEAFEVLKNYSEMEKSQWDRRLTDQKEKSNKRLQKLKEDLERKHREERESLEQELNEIREKTMVMERNFNEKLQNVQYDHDIKTQKMKNNFTEQKTELEKSQALLTQELTLTKKDLIKKLQEQQQSYERTLQENRIQYEAEYKQLGDRLMEDKKLIEEKYEGLKKVHNQSEKALLVLKNDLEKERLVFREKEKHLAGCLAQAEDKLKIQIEEHSHALYEIKETHHNETERLNYEIEKLKEMNVKLEQEKNNLENQKECEKNSLIAKNKYLTSKSERSRKDYDDIVDKFQTTVSSLRMQIDKKIQEVADIRQKCQAEFTRQLKDKEKQIQREKKETTDKIYRLQTENKSLKEKILVVQVANSSNSAKESKLVENNKKIKEQCQRKVQDYSRVVDKLKAENDKLKAQLNSLREDQSLKDVLTENCDASRIYNKSERNSILGQCSINDNKRYSFLNTEHKKHQNGGTPLIQRKERPTRNLNINEVTGIMKYQ